MSAFAKLYAVLTLPFFLTIIYKLSTDLVSVLLFSTRLKIHDASSFRNYITFCIGVRGIGLFYVNFILRSFVIR